MRASIGPFEQAEFRADEEEAAIIGALVLEPTLLADVRRRLQPADFFREFLKHVFTAMCALDDRGEVPTFFAVKREAHLTDPLAGQLLALINDCPTTAHLKHYVVGVQRASQRRNLYHAAHQIAVTSADGDLDSEGAVRKSAEIVAGVRRGSDGATEVLDGAALADLVRRQYLDPSAQDQPRGIPTGLYELDHQLSGQGFEAGQLILLAGRPGMGKSSALRDFARSFALRGTVLFASNEMRGAGLGVRDLAAYSGVSIRLILDGTLNEQQRRDLAHAATAVQFLRITTYTDGAMSSAQLRTFAASLATREDLVAIVVDYLQQMISDPGKTDFERVSYTARALKAMAVDLHVPVVAGSQLSRATVQDNANRRPRLTDLRSSGELEQVADVVLSIHREAYYFPTEDHWRKGGQNGKYPGNVAEVSILKQRQGISGITVEALWEPNLATFRNLTRRDESF